MNDLPTTWLKDLSEVYPKRSGPNGWKGGRLFLAVRRALLESTWGEIIDGIKRYKAYCEKSGIEGSSFVQTPTRFITDQSYLESFIYQAPRDPKIIEHRRKEEERWAKAERDGRSIVPPQLRDPFESIGAFETRIEIARTRAPARPVELDQTICNDGLNNRIADLSARMRIK